MYVLSLAAGAYSHRVVRDQSAAYTAGSLSVVWLSSRRQDLDYMACIQRGNDL
jgi:hypothetical protein